MRAARIIGHPAFTAATTLAVGFAALGLLLALVVALAREQRAEVDVGNVVVWTAMAIAIATPIARRIAQRRRTDPFEPLTLATAAFIVLFLGRTAYDIATGNLSFAGGFDVSSAYRDALLAALVAIIGFELGYGLPFARAGARRLPALAQRPGDALLIGAGLALTLVAGIALGARAAVAGGFETLFLNRGEGSLDLGGVPFISESVVITIPAVLLLWSVSRRARLLGTLISAVPAAIILVASVPSGDRRYILQALFAAGVYLFIRADRRPSARAIGVAALAALFLVVTPLRAARSGDVDYWQSVTQALSDPAASVSELFQSGDTEMVDTVAFLIQNVGAGHDIDWQYGMSFLTETVLQPVPRELWPDKPKPIRTQIIEANWGMTNGRCVSICPTFSVLGSLYADLGLVSVALGSLAIGFAFRAWYEYFALHRRSTLIRAAYAPTVFVAFYVWWSSLSVLVLAAGLFIAPIVLIALFARPAAATSRVRLAMPA